MTSAVNNEFPGVQTLISGNTAANSLFQSQHREHPATALVCCQSSRDDRVPTSQAAIPGSLPVQVTPGAV